MSSVKEFLRLSAIKRCLAATLILEAKRLGILKRKASVCCSGDGEMPTVTDRFLEMENAVAIDFVDVEAIAAAYRITIYDVGLRP